MDSGSATWSHSPSARSYIFNVSLYAKDGVRVAVIDHWKALFVSWAADQWWAISNGAVSCRTSSGRASSSPTISSTPKTAPGR